MTQVNRLGAPFGSLLERDAVLRFEFEGRPYTGYRGDTLASALAANDRWLISRSFKYHRARGVASGAGHDGNALVQLPGEPNAPADRVPLREGLRATAQHYRSSLERDSDAFIERFADFLPVGFYYKTFFRPRGAWEKIWAPIVRRRAGLGVVDPYPPAAAPFAGYYDKQYLFYDVVVVGAGAAGIEAAVAAAAGGAEVLLVDENAWLGGALAWARLDAAGAEAATTRRELVNALEASSVEVMTGAVCNGWFSDNWLALVRGERLYKVRARQLIAAVGAIEQPAVFRGNDLPGVMLGSCAQRLMRLYGVRPGRRGAVLTANEDGYGVALDLLEAGVELAAVVDLRKQAEGPLCEAVAAKGVEIHRGHAIYEALADESKTHLARLEVRRIVGRGQCSPDGVSIDCDLLCASAGYVPAWQLPCQSGARLGYDESAAAFTIQGLREGIHAAGSVNGHAAPDAARAEGRRAAWRALRRLGRADGPEPGVDEFAQVARVNHPWPIFPHPQGKEFVDLDEDLMIRDIQNAVAEGYDSIELVKRYSTAGMGPTQGRHAALAVARLTAEATGAGVAATGVTTARPPFAPEKLGVLAGRGFQPVRRTAMHHRHLALGARMTPVGAWLRPAWYGPADAGARRTVEEALHVRRAVGLIDVSTLGGIEVRGPDAAELMQRMYTWNFARQPVGRARYALMCNEAGVVIDDGVACRVEDEWFYVTATTGGVERVYQNMLRWNAQWRLDVDVAHVTAAWCGVNLAGPASRRVLERVCDVDLSADAFPYMGFRVGVVAGIPARVMRVGFVGELGYEIHAPQHHGAALWDALLEAGREDDARPFGVEAQRLLRLEKGHFIIGQDTDAMTTPREVHMQWAVNDGKPFFIGQRTLRELAARPPLRALVGYVIDDPAAPLPQESHLVLDGDEMTGRVTSTYYSPTLGRGIGLAYVAPRQAQPGSRITIKSRGGCPVAARVVELPFYDPENKRQEP